MAHPIEVDRVTFFVDSKIRERNVHSAVNNPTAMSNNYKMLGINTVTVDTFFISKVFRPVSNVKEMHHLRVTLALNFIWIRKHVSNDFVDYWRIYCMLPRHLLRFIM